MKKILALALLIVNNTEATTLRCEQNIAHSYADMNIGLPIATSGGANIMYGTVIATIQKGSAFLKFPRTASATLTLPTLAESSILEANYLHFCHHSGVSNPYIITCVQGPLITGSARTITATFPITNSTSGVMTGYLVLSTTPGIPIMGVHINRRPASSIQPVVTTNVTLLDASGKSLSATQDSHFSIITTPKTTDSITIPTTIDLGTLQVGVNVVDTPVVTEINTNSLGLKFTSTTTAGASFSVNGKIAQAGTVYKPPFKLGMNLEPTARPGTYTSKVTATWTCP
ncbi:hypothetical protein HV213_23775 [Klebsiella sp. RHBSTW-00484]|uniref:hypothetical protein n=1 Tax=unclassified Klebsiella TaxID=2608929 RepID=UPI0015E4B1D7|nr:MULTISPECIES: hypothetical protein [unclassified Klebsiella]MBA7843249.1 hypothetical protein [Klebsiella sp. RHBSTW-00465]QLO38621.1 hypothetical protein HV213_23775 [Klebsiella sp. RHBSTW-00484]QLT78141.1 hypothetical protein HV204_23775 [Klebsiella sp. RHBSTW-00464]